ncbi:hypothetical protein KAX97_13295 [candidate division WOR-3 bacterium]|nr:hypothetical protein [candidate division WOR-3 bacterium]
MKKFFKHIKNKFSRNQIRKLFTALKFNILNKCVFRLSFTLIVIFLFLIFFEIEIATMSIIQNAPNLLTIIIGALASILGIIIAVMLVAFEILRKSYNIYAFKTFFKNEKLIELVTLYVSTIIISSITLILISDPIAPNDIILVYFSIALFVISLLVLFPYSSEIISSAQPKEKIRGLVNQIKSFHQFNPASICNSHLEENPIFVLSEVGIRTLRDNDLFTPQFILQTIEKRSLELLKKLPPNTICSSVNNIVKAYLEVIKSISYHAIKLQQESILWTTLSIIAKIHNIYAEKKIPWHEVFEINKFIENYLEKLLASDLDNITASGLYMVESIMIQHLKKNIPQENEITSLHFQTKEIERVRSDPDKELQWNHVTHDYIGILSNITEKAIDLKKSEILSVGLRAVRGVGRDVLKMQLGDLQKQHIIRSCDYYMKYLISKSVETGLYGKTYIFYPFNFFYLIEALELKKEFSKDPLIKCYEILRLLNKNELLDFTTLNELASVGRRCVQKIDEHSIYKEALIFIINVFNKLRIEIEIQLNDTYKPLYLALYNQTQSLKHFMKSLKKKDEEVENLVDLILSRFTYYEKIKSELEQGIIEWPSFESDN